jgi:hypothetical protein
MKMNRKMREETKAELERLERFEKKLEDKLKKEESKLKRNILSGLVFLGTGAALSHSIPGAYEGIQSGAVTSGDYAVFWGAVITTLATTGLGGYNLLRAYIRADTVL